MGKMTSTTGIGVRGGNIQLGSMATQPIPIVLPTAFPVTRTASVIQPVIASPDMAIAMTTGRAPSLQFPANMITNGRIAEATRIIFPPSFNGINNRPVSPALSGVRTNQPLNPNPRRPNEESLSLSRLVFVNEGLQQVDPHGISKLRPEIISLMDFEPVYNGSSLEFSDVGLLLDTQYQARHLREQTLFQLVDGIQQTDFAQELQLIQNEFAASFDTITNAASFYRDVIANIQAIKNGFDVKNIPNSAFDLRSFKTLRSFYESMMLFPQDTFNNFSNTKLLMQLLFDIRSIAEGYSLNLLNLSDPDRQSNGAAALSPISIDRTYNLKNGFEFGYDTVRSYTYAINATGQSFFNRFNASLPQSADDRIKILINLLSKELRVSRGLGRPRVKANLTQKFAATTTDGSPFDNLFGGVGATIFEPVTGEGSIAALLTLNNTPGVTVLPFETKYIDANTTTQKTYVPGSNFFVDSILNVPAANGFNLLPLKSYVEKYIDTVDSTATIMTELFDYGDVASPLSPLAVFKLALTSMQTGVKGLRGIIAGSLGRVTQGINVADAAVVAILRLAGSDQTLKSMFFQYLILSVLYDQNARFFCETIISDLSEDIRNLNAVVFTEGTPLPNLKNKNEINAYRTTMGTTIQNRVSSLMNRIDLGAIAQAQPRRTDVTTGQIVVGFDTDTVYGIPNALEVSELTKGFVNFFANLETILGNEATNILDSAKRTRFNSLSVSTLALVAFEVFSQLIIRFTKVDFQTSTQRNFPDMVVDSRYNTRMHSSFTAIIAEPELPLPIIAPVMSSAPPRVRTAKQENLERSTRTRQAGNAVHTVGQATQAAALAGTSAGDMQNGITTNAAILAGQFATAGSGLTTAAELAMRGVSNRSNPSGLLDDQAIDQNLNSIAFKLFQEDFSVACGMHILLTLKARLRGSLDLATNYFTPQTLTTLNGLNATSTSDISNNLTPSQVRLLLRESDAYQKALKANTQNIQFVPTSPTDEDTKNALLSLLSKSSFRDTTDANLRYRLLSVGIPSGFSKNLTERLSVSTISQNSFQRVKDYDVITINVYKRSLEFSQLIFKPKKFMFDLSLFSSGKFPEGINSSDNFSKILSKIVLKDYQDTTRPIDVNIESIINDQRYDFLPGSASKRLLVENHVLSDLFSSYMQFLTGIKMEESTFVNTRSATYRALSLGNGQDLTPKFSELVRQYLIGKRQRDIRRNPALRTLPNITIEAMLLSAEVDQATKDILRLLTFGNVAFKTQNAIANLLSPKLFERIFTIPLDIDSFEIDMSATTSTTTGKEFVEKTFFQNRLEPGALKNGIHKLVPRTKDDTVFEDFFVTIELVE